MAYLLRRYSEDSLRNRWRKPAKTRGHDQTTKMFVRNTLNLLVKRPCSRESVKQTKVLKSLRGRVFAHLKYRGFDPQIFSDKKVCADIKKDHRHRSTDSSAIDSKRANEQNIQNELK